MPTIRPLSFIFLFGTLACMTTGCSSKQNVALGKWEAAVDTLVESRKDVHKSGLQRDSFEPTKYSYKDGSWTTDLPLADLTYLRVSKDSNHKYIRLQFTNGYDIWDSRLFVAGCVRVHALYLGRMESNGRLFDLFMVQISKQEWPAMLYTTIETLSVHPVARLVNGAERWVSGENNLDAVRSENEGPESSRLDFMYYDNYDVSLKGRHVEIALNKPGFSWEIEIPDD